VATVGVFLGFIARDFLLRERFIVYERRIELYLQTWSKVADAYMALKQLTILANRPRDDPEFRGTQAKASQARFDAFVSLEKASLILDELTYRTCDDLLRSIMVYIMAAGESQDFGDTKDRRQREGRIDGLYSQARDQAQGKVQGWVRRLEYITDKCLRWAKVAGQWRPWRRS
jgi:hypothetical protein